MVSRLVAGCAVAFGVLVAAISPTAADDVTDKFTQNEVVKAASDFFGTTTEAVAKAVQRVFADQGSGAVVVGLRYGEGWLVRKNQEVTKVYWQGPSVGFDLGGNASKVFVLVYNLGPSDRLFQRFPGVEGSYYLIAGIGVNKFTPIPAIR